MSKINEVTTLYKQLKTEWNSSHRNLSKCEKLLSDLKVCNPDHRTKAFDNINSFKFPARAD